MMSGKNKDSFVKDSPITRRTRFNLGGKVKGMKTNSKRKPGQEVSKKNKRTIMMNAGGKLSKKY